MTCLIIKFEIDTDKLDFVQAYKDVKEKIGGSPKFTSFFKKDCLLVQMCNEQQTMKLMKITQLAQEKCEIKAHIHH